MFRVFKEGKFFNSNCPAKSIKLLAPIWMDISFSQLVMINERWISPFFEFARFSIDTLENESFITVIVVRFFNPSILKRFTKLKHFSPIVRVVSCLNLHKFSSVISLQQLLPTTSSCTVVFNCSNSFEEWIVTFRVLENIIQCVLNENK